MTYRDSSHTNGIIKTWPKAKDPEGTQSHLQQQSRIYFIKLYCLCTSHRNIRTQQQGSVGRWRDDRTLLVKCTCAWAFIYMWSQDSGCRGRKAQAHADNDVYGGDKWHRLVYISGNPHSTRTMYVGHGRFTMAARRTHAQQSSLYTHAH